jgi:hypothetical protein
MGVIKRMKLNIYDHAIKFNVFFLLNYMVSNYFKLKFLSRWRFFIERLMKKKNQ